VTEECLNVLVVEKNSADAESVRGILDQIQDGHFNIQCSTDLEAVSATLAENRAELMVLDLAEENGSALEVLGKVMAAAPTIPCIVLAASTDDMAKFSGAIASGNCDFLNKSQMTPAEMARSIKYVAALGKVRTLEATTRNQARINRLIKTVSQSLTAPELLRPMLQRCAQAVVDELDAAFARIWIFERSENVLVLQSSAGLYTHIDGKHARIPLGALKIGRIASERTPHLTNSVLTDSWVSDPEWAAREKMVAFAGYPLLVGESLVGVLGMFSQHLLSDMTLECLAALSDIIAQGIERKRSEQELFSLSQHEQRLLEVNADALIVLTPEGRIAQANLAAEQLSGIPREDLIGKYYVDLVTDPERAVEAFKQTLSEGSVHDFIAHLKHGSGRVIECSINANVLRNESGQVDCVIASMRDITVQLEEQQRLKRMAAIIEQSSDAIIGRTIEGIVTSWNKGAEIIYGYTASEMLGKSVSVLIPADRLHEFPELMERFNSGESVEHFETQRLRKNGECVDVSVSLSPISDSSGNIIAVSTICRDISEKKGLERKLERSEALFRQICSEALDGIMCIDPEGKITVWNRAAEKMFGYQCEQVIGKNLHSLLAPARYRESYSVGLENFSKAGQGQVLGKLLELEALRADGVEFPIELAVSSIQIDGNWHAVGIVRDITERRQSELRIRENESALMEERNSITKANKILSDQAMELSRHAAQMELLTQLGEYLQTCTTDEEIPPIVTNFIAKVFPETSGTLFVCKESSHRLEQVASWGDGLSGSQGFAIDGCWALRRGQPHSFRCSEAYPRCGHVLPDVRSCLCVPLVLLGETYGVMHVQWNVETPDADDETLAVRLTGDAALALANTRLRKELKDLSIRDPLTGLFNRRYMEEFFTQELVRSRRKECQLSVLMIDIDHFKEFNDTFGHEAGDAVLCELGKFLREQLRASDLICRYGGEEFIVLLSEAPIDVAQRRAEQLRADIKLMRVRFQDELLPEINISVGVAAFPGSGETMQELIRASDLALYMAKEQGRDRVCVSDPAVHSGK